MELAHTAAHCLRQCETSAPSVWQPRNTLSLILQALPHEGPTFAGGGSLDPRAVYTPSEDGSPHAPLERPLADALKSSSGWVHGTRHKMWTDPQSLRSVSRG